MCSLIKGPSIVKKFSTMKKLLTFLFIPILSHGVNAQCATNVPTYYIDLSANPDTSWVLFESDALDRLGQCCGVTTNESCIRFEITLNENAAGVFFDYDGAGAYGSLNWMVDCGTPHNLRDTICVTDPGPFTLTFCKPGSDNGNYTLISIPKPTFPEDQFVPMNCIQQVEVLGVTTATIEWESISPGAPGDYNMNLSCIDCLEPIFTPDQNGPSEIEYRVCGYPILDYCVGYFNYCDTVKFTIQDSLKLSITPNDPAFCSGGSIQLEAQATGGDGNYNYFWYNSSMQLVGMGPTYAADSAGYYTCEVRDGNYEVGSCDDFYNTVTVVETFPPIITTSIDQILCSTSPNAIISGSFQYALGANWSGGSGLFQNGTSALINTYIPTQNELEIGNVTLTLSSVGVGGGCNNASEQIQLTFSDTIETNMMDISVLCKNSSISINPTITGGLMPYAFSWTNGVNTANTDLYEGLNCLTIIDVNGCQITECINISAPTAIDIVTSSIPVSSNGGNDGTASVNVSGGVGPYAFLWSNGGTSATITGLSYGIYSVIVTDANGCIREGSLVVNEPRCNGFFVSTTLNDVQCYNGVDGSAEAMVSGGQAPFIYSWNDPANQTTAIGTNLSAGVYTIQVTDATGCVAMNTASINEPDPLNNTMNHVNVSMIGGNDGQAQVNINGGTAGYTYLWSNGETNSLAINLLAGWYSVTITDANGCMYVDNVNISQPPCDGFSLWVGTTSPLCNGMSTGLADLNILNGVSPFSITWSNGQLNTESLSNLSAGIYSVQVMDGNGCQAFQSFGITEPSALSVGLNATPSTCFGLDNGTIDASLTGGTYPYYSFSWSNGALTEDLINIDPGFYSISVVDENGCQVSASVTLDEPTILSVTSNFEDVTCFGYSNGSIDVEVSGGTMPYVYSWSNGAITQDLSGIDIGGYILNLLDANACSPVVPLTVIIDQSTLVEIQSISISCPIPGENTSLVNIVPIGGIDGYAISSDGGITYGSYGDYNLDLNVDNGFDLIAMDTMNCLSVITHIDIDSNVAIISSDFNTCYGIGQTDELVTVNIVGGSSNYIISSDNGVVCPVGDYSITLPINNVYELVATDSSGCQSEPYSILLPDILVIEGSGVDPSCFGLQNGSIDVSVTGGIEPYQYTWSDGNETEDISDLGSGIFSLSFLDANNCFLEQEFVITQPEEISVDLSAVVNANNFNISFFGGSDGIITISVEGGTTPYFYNCSLDSVSTEFVNLSAGIYTITIIDSFGCQFLSSIELTQPEYLELPTIFTPNQDGYNDVFDIHGIEAYPDNKLTIVNRWGNVVYEKEKYFNTWKGTHSNGEELPDGVYFAILKINGGEIEKNTFVHIKRY